MAASKSVSGVSVLAEGAVVTGRITGDGDLEIRGRVEGEVELQGDLTLAHGGIAKASLSGARVVIGGAVLGDIIGSEAIVLEASARVVGNLRAPRIAVALGAQVRGELDMGDVGDAGAVAAPVRAARGPITPAKPVVVTRKNPPVPVAAPAPAAPPAKKAPPEPVVPAIKKGAKAAKKRA